VGFDNITSPDGKRHRKLHDDLMSYALHTDRRPERPTARVRHLTKRYGSATVVNDVTFDIPTASVVGLIGPNGAGKTTTMRCLLGLAAPSGGDIDLIDATVGAKDWGQVLRKVGSLIESPNLYERMTARQNIVVQELARGIGGSQSRADEILELVGLADRSDDEARDFSHGMKQRLGIGLALVGSPELIVLDEPTNGLDPAGIADIRNLIGRLAAQGSTVLVSSHQLAELEQVCDHFIVLQDGKVIASDSADRLKATAGTQTQTFIVEVAIDEHPATEAALKSEGWAIVKTEPGWLLVSHPTAAGRDLNSTLIANDVIAEAITRNTVSLEDAFMRLTNPEDATAFNTHTPEVGR